MKRLLILIILLIISNITYASCDKTASLIVDVNRSKVLHAHNAYTKMYPASLTKMMTLYLIFDALKSSKITMNTQIKISKKAANQQPSKLFLKPGEKISVKQAILALIVKSANDVAYAVAEHLGNGNINTFVNMMNHKAKKLGMKNTHFENPNGWHNTKQYTTAYDMAKLGIALKRYHNKYYYLFVTQEFKFKNKTIKTTNKVLKRNSHITGIKTGFTIPSGFNLVTSYENGKKYLIGVIMGEESAQQRDDKMLKMILQYSKV